MPFTIDNTAFLAHLATLPARVARGADAGLGDVAIVAEHLMQTSPAHGDMSGAAHASSFAAVLGPDAQAHADAAYDVAESLLTGFTGHAGKAERVTVDAPTPNVRGIVLGRPVDYAQALEDGGKAVVGPTLEEIQEFALRRAQEGIREELTK